MQFSSPFLVHPGNKEVAESENEMSARNIETETSMAAADQYIGHKAIWKYVHSGTKVSSPLKYAVRRSVRTSSVVLGE